MAGYTDLKNINMLIGKYQAGTKSYQRSLLITLIFLEA